MPAVPAVMRAPGRMPPVVVTAGPVVARGRPVRVPAVSMGSTARPGRLMASMAAPVVRAVKAATVGPAGPVAPRLVAGPRVRPVASVWLLTARRAGTAGPAAAVMTPRG